MFVILFFNIGTVFVPVLCFRNHTALTAIAFTHFDPVEDNVHSEYFYGKCAHPYKTLVNKVKHEYEDLKNKMIVRGWIEAKEEPNCVYIKAESSYTDIVKYHAYKFNVCVCHIVYNYGGYIYEYYYYEWYIPVQMKKDITWTLEFYRTQLNDPNLRRGYGKK